MSVYHLRPWEVQPVEAGIARTLLRAQRRRPSRHAAIGEDLVLFDGSRRVGRARCVLRGLVLLDADGIRSAMPLLHEADDAWAAADAGFWRRGYEYGAARLLGHPDWFTLAYVLRYVLQLGRAPWLLELIGWKHGAIGEPGCDERGRWLPRPRGAELPASLKHRGDPWPPFPR